MLFSRDKDGRATGQDHCVLTLPKGKARDLNTT